MAKNNKDLAEILSEILIEMQGMRSEQVVTNSRLIQLEDQMEKTNSRLDTVNIRLDSLNNHVKSNTVSINELRLSFMRLADIFEINVDKRLKALEEKVFNS